MYDRSTLYYINESFLPFSLVQFCLYFPLQFIILKFKLLLIKRYNWEREFIVQLKPKFYLNKEEIN